MYRQNPDYSGKTTFHAKKRFGQNFILDKNILQKIVSHARIGKDVFVIEVGPGTGALTGLLLAAANKVLAYEIDRELIPLLADRFKNTDNLILVNRDILEVDIEEDITKYFPADAEIVLVSNLPYYITTPILLKFLETTAKVQRLVVMTQLEVARRLTSKPGTKDYNALSVAVDYRAEAKFLFKVPRTVFKPAPNVDSAVIMLEVAKQNRYSPKDEKKFFALVRNAFAQRRKTLINNLLAAYPDYDREFYENLLAACNIPLKSRAETVDVNQFVALADAFANQLANK